MGKYLHLFLGESAKTEHDEMYESGYTEPWVAYIEETESMTWNKAHEVEYDACEYKELLNFGNMKSLRLEHFPELQVSFALIGHAALNGGGFDGGAVRGGDEDEPIGTLSNPCEILNYVTFFWSGNTNSGGGEVIVKKGALSKGGESDGVYYYVYPDGTQETMNTIDDVNNIINNVILPQLPNCEFFNWSDFNTNDTCFCICGAKAIYDSNVDPGFTVTRWADMNLSQGHYKFISNDVESKFVPNDGESNTIVYIDATYGDKCDFSDTLQITYQGEDGIYYLEIYDGGGVNEDLSKVKFQKFGDLMNNFFGKEVICSCTVNTELTDSVNANVLLNNVDIIDVTESYQSDEPDEPIIHEEM